MDFPAGSSSSSTSKVFYSQPFISQSKIYESSQNGLGSNSISLPVTFNNSSTFPDNEIIVLSSSDSEVELELNSTNNKSVVFNKDKGKEREHSTEPDLGTISSAVKINTVQLNEPSLFGIINQPLVHDKDKSEDQEESSPNLNITQIDDSDDELVDMEIDYDIPQPTTIASNQLISWTIDTELGSAINNAPREQQLREPSSVGKVIRFFNLYNYTFDIFDIVIDLSNKYQEIFPEDTVHLQLYQNNPCVLLELLSKFLSNRLNSDVRGTDFIKLDILAAEYYEKLKNAEIGRQGLYRTNFRNNKFHSTATSLNEEKISVVNSRINSNLLTTKDKKAKNKKAKKNKSSNGPRVDLEKILSSAVQLPEKKDEKKETKVPPLSITEHLNKFVFNKGGFINSITSNLSLNGNYNLTISPQESKQTLQTFSSPVFPTVDTNFSTSCGTSDNQAMQKIASTSSNTGNHTVIESGSQPTATTASYEINPNPPSNNEVMQSTQSTQSAQSTENNIRRHVPREERPIPDLSFDVEKEYKSMMADAIQKLAITNLAMKHNPTSGPGELDGIVNKFKIKKIAKDSSSAYAYNETLINIYNHGGMDMVMERLEENISSHLKVKPKESRRQRKKRRLLQKQAKGECCDKNNDNLNQLDKDI